MRSQSRQGNSLNTTTNSSNHHHNSTNRSNSSSGHGHTSNSVTIRSNSSAEHNSTTASKKLSQEELAKLSERISKPKPPPAPLGPLHAPHTIPKEQLDHSIERMYKQAMEARTRNIANARQRRDDSEAPKVVKITPEEVDESVQRLYNQAVGRKQRNIDALRGRHLFTPSPPRSRSNSPNRSPSRADGGGGADSSTAATTPAALTAEIVSRLYTHGLEEKAKKEEQRIQKYVVATEPKMKKVDHDEMVAIVDRLYSKK